MQRKLGRELSTFYLPPPCWSFNKRLLSGGLERLRHSPIVPKAGRAEWDPSTEQRPGKPGAGLTQHITCITAPLCSQGVHLGTVIFMTVRWGLGSQIIKCLWLPIIIIATIIAQVIISDSKVSDLERLQRGSNLQNKEVLTCLGKTEFFGVCLREVDNYSGCWLVEKQKDCFLCFSVTQLLSPEYIRWLSRGGMCDVFNRIL